MVRLAQDSRGNYKARKRLPDDVREEYGRLFGQGHEAKFYAPASTPSDIAKRKFTDWLGEVEGRIATIRAQHKGEGAALTRQQARALAGEWYDWFIARHPTDDLEKWENVRDHIYDAMREAVGDERWEANAPDELWRQDEDLREEIRPVLADAGETAQFLSIKRLALDNPSRDQFLDFLYEDLAEALKRLMRISDGDYGPDKYRERFPKFEVADNGRTPQELFAQWVSERKPAVSSVESWRYVFLAMTEHFKGRSAASITADEAQHWVKGLVTSERSARTVRKTWITASRTVFGWAVEQQLLTRNPFEQVKVTVPKVIRVRETKAFLPEERLAILRAALEIKDTRTPFEAAKRWVPWLLAYTGARAGEITQLRKSDVIKRGDVYALKLTPEAGTIKTGHTRVVPLHEHLIAQGFLDFVAKHSDGPLFYEPDKKAKSEDLAKVKKPRSAQVRQRLAHWVRSLGVTESELAPNHAWRHTFKQIADRVGISERASDTITGHAHRSVGATYGTATLEDMAEAMKKFPRYPIEAVKSTLSSPEVIESAHNE